MHENVLPPLTMNANYGWLIVHYFLSRLENIKVAILSGEWLQKFGLVICSALIWPFGREGSLSCHSCCGNVISVCTISSEGPLHLGRLLRQTRVTDDLFQPELILSSGWGDPRKKNPTVDIYYAIFWSDSPNYLHWYFYKVTFLLYSSWNGPCSSSCVLYTFVKTAEQKPLMADSEIQCIFLLVWFNVNCRYYIN